MIAQTSTLFLATLVFGAASVAGAPIRVSDTLSESVARSEIPAAQPVSRAIVDVPDHRRRSNPDGMTRRSARLIYERDEPFATPVAREPFDIAVEPTTEEIQRRYPRRYIRDFYEKREPATSIKETTMVVTKTTVHDTAADAAAFGIGQAASAAGAAKPSSSIVSINIPIPVVGDGSVQSSTSTILSVSSATTILPASGTTTATSTDATATASSTATSTDATATATGTATATDATATASATDSANAAASTSASSTSTSSAATATATDAAAGANNTGDKKTDGTATTGDNKTTTDNGAITVDGTTNTPAVGATNDDKAADNKEARRSVKVSTSPIARRRINARSGASWASWSRRQVTPDS